MTLTDTGPLVAIVDAADTHHERAMQCLNDNKSISEPLATTEACLTEALYLLGESVGWRGQEILLDFIADGEVVVLIPPIDGPIRSRAYMQRYKDTPCDYADATLLVAAEETGQRHIFTVDKHFYAYRLTDRTAMEVIS